MYEGWNVNVNWDFQGETNLFIELMKPQND